MNPSYGTISVNIRIIGQILFMKFSQQNPQMNQMIKQFREKGAEVIIGDSGWIKIDIFHNKSIVKLGNLEFDVKVKTQDEIELILYNFYKMKYMEAKFVVEDKDE